MGMWIPGSPGGWGKPHRTSPWKQKKSWKWSRICQEQRWRKFSACPAQCLATVPGTLGNATSSKESSGKERQRRSHTCAAKISARPCPWADSPSSLVTRLDRSTSHSEIDQQNQLTCSNKGNECCWFILRAEGAKQSPLQCKESLGRTIVYTHWASCETKCRQSYWHDPWNACQSNQGSSGRWSCPPSQSPWSTCYAHSP